MRQELDGPPAPMWASDCPFCEQSVLVYEEPPRCPLCACPLDEERMHPYVWPGEERTAPPGAIEAG